MAMRLCDNFKLVLVNCNFSIIVDESWHVFLLYDIDSMFAKSEVVVLLKEVHGLIVSIIRGHDAKRNIERCFILVFYIGKGSVLAGFHVISIVFQVAIV